MWKQTWQDADRNSAENSSAISCEHEIHFEVNPALTNSYVGSRENPYREFWERWKHDRAKLFNYTLIENEITERLVNSCGIRKTNRCIFDGIPLTITGWKRKRERRKESSPCSVTHQTSTSSDGFSITGTQRSLQRRYCQWRTFLFRSHLNRRTIIFISDMQGDFIIRLLATMILWLKKKNWFVSAR